MNNRAQFFKRKLKKVVYEDLATALADYEFPNEQCARGIRITRTYLLKKCLQKPARALSILLGTHLYVPYVEVVLTTHCSLRCKNCSALMPLYERRAHLDLSLFVSSMERLLSAVDSVHVVRLLGGEPLLYPDLVGALEFVAGQDKIKRAAIVTNGTMLIRDERVLKILQENPKLYVFISDYGVHSRHFQDLVRQLEEHHIPYMTFDNGRPWIDYGGFEERHKTVPELMEQYLICTHRNTNLLNGKWYQCYRASHATNLGLIPDRPEEYIDLTDNQIPLRKLRRRIRKFLFSYVPYVESCKYCDFGPNPRLVPPGLQEEKKTDTAMQESAPESISKA